MPEKNVPLFRRIRLLVEEYTDTLLPFRKNVGGRQAWILLQRFAEHTIRHALRQVSDEQSP